MDFPETNPNLTTQDREHLFILDIRLYAFGGILLPMGIVGIALNSFTILVLLHPRMRNSTNVYLMALSMANIVCLLNFIFLYSLRYLLSYQTFQNGIYFKRHEPNAYESAINLILRFWSPVFSTFQLYAIYLTCAVTVDRWIYLKWPLKADKICTIPVTIMVICATFAFCFIYNLPRLFEVDSDLMVAPNNSTYYQARPTEFGRNALYRLIYDRYSYFIFVYGLPFSVLVVVNLGIVQKLMETEKRKSHLLGTSKAKKKHVQDGSWKDKKASVHGRTKELKTTIMILAVVIAFFFCQFPYLILRLLVSYGKHMEFQIAKVICDLFVALNCCVNFLIYCFFGINFRRIAKFMLLHPSCHPWNPANMQRVENRRANKISKRKNEKEWQTKLKSNNVKETKLDSELISLSPSNALNTDVAAI